MTLYQFIQLPEIEKVNQLQFAVRLASRNVKNIEYALFELHNFYVEVEYNKELIFIHPFESTEYLDPYLTTIDINYFS